LAFLRKKKSRGKTYYYVAESKRINGKPRIVNEVYVGTIDKIRQMALGQKISPIPSKLQVLEWGSLAAVEAIEKDIDLIGIVDEIIPKRNQGLSVGEYLYLSVMNRCIAPKSKRAMGEWFKKRALFEFRSIDLSLLNSQRYWDHFDKFTDDTIDMISKAVAEKIVKLYRLYPDWMLFDTTNFYTFMDAATHSELSKTGHNKQGRHNLRQVGLAMMTDRKDGIPLYHKVFPGNTHDSKLFTSLIHELFDLMKRFDRTKEKLTLVFDKGMNSDTNMAWLDDDPTIHFITSYSTWHAYKLASISLKKFSPLSGRVNTGREHEDAILAYRTTMELWGKERTVIVTYNPKTARKKSYRFKEKLDDVRDALLEIRRKVREEAPQWRNPEKIRERVEELLSEKKARSLFTTELKKVKGKLVFTFRQKPYYIKKVIDRMGRNIIVTDRHDLSTEEIVEAYLSRHGIEDRYKQMKNPYRVSFMPQYHWTDQKIKVHALTCTLALTYLALINWKIKRAGIRESIDTVMEQLRELHSCLMFYPGKQKPHREIEEMSRLQKKALEAIQTHPSRL
jgi:transposase